MYQNIEFFHMMLHLYKLFLSKSFQKTKMLDFRLKRETNIIFLISLF